MVTVYLLFLLCNFRFTFKYHYATLASVLLVRDSHVVSRCTYLFTNNFLIITCSLWGTVATAMAASKNFASIASARFFIGVFEAGKMIIVKKNI